MLVLVVIIVMMVAAVMLMLILIVIMVMVVTATMLIVIIIVVMIMMCAVYYRSILSYSLVTSVMMMVVMMFLFFHNKLKKLCLKVIVTFECIKNLFSRDLIKRSCYYSSLGIVLTNKLNRLLDLLLICLVCSCKNDRSGILNLVNEELTEVLDINLSLGYVHNCNRAVKFHLLRCVRNILDSSHNI